MQNRGKALLTALSAALVLAATVGVADARRFEVSNQGIRAVWSQFKFIPTGAGVTVTCPVTLEGTLHSRILSKVSGQLIGFITRAIIRRPCTAGEAWFLNGSEVLEAVVVANTLPWHVRYDSFTGALPRIERVKIQVIGFSFLLNVAPFGRCLYRSTAAKPAFFIFEVEPGGAIAGLIAGEESRIPFLAGELFCPTESSIGGVGVVTLLGTATRITIRLVA